ncbi:hypothetical protein Trydic_g5891 [Trypoxylus dichotomus]
MRCPSDPETRVAYCCRAIRLSGGRLRGWRPCTIEDKRTRRVQGCGEQYLFVERSPRHKESAGEQTEAKCVPVDIESASRCRGIVW